MLNHDVLAPGAGFDSHRHSGVDLVTYVVAGALEHRDSAGHQAVVRAGEVQVLRSGDGVTHSERNASSTEPVEYVQMWLRSDAPTVSYDVPAPADGDALAQTTAGTMLLLRVNASGGRQIGAPRMHVYVLEGTVVLGADRLVEGDAVRATGQTLLFEAQRPASLLVWQLHG